MWADVGEEGRASPSLLMLQAAATNLADAAEHNVSTVQSIPHIPARANGPLLPATVPLLPAHYSGVQCMHGE
eukprot:1150292-Pelagomonas_calceolata.AAC.3